MLFVLMKCTRRMRMSGVSRSLGMKWVFLQLQLVKFWCETENWRESKRLHLIFENKKVVSRMAISGI